MLLVGRVPCGSTASHSPGTAGVDPEGGRTDSRRHTEISGGSATLQRVWEADPYALVFALAFDMGVHFYLYNSQQVDLPQEAYFSAADIVNAVKEMK